MSVKRYYSSVEKKMKGGLFSIMVLHTIGSSKRPIHGYRITKALDSLTGGVIFIQAGTIYPILKNLESQGLIRHSMEKSTRGPPRKAYRLTDEGRMALEKIDGLLDGLVMAVGRVRGGDWPAHGNPRGLALHQ
jgi:PadR family transcriptional regulator PadR